MTEILKAIADGLYSQANAISNVLQTLDAPKISPPKIPQEIEQMEPEYLNPDYDLLSLPSIYRFNQSGLRYYFTAKDGNVAFYPSVTTIIEKTTPTSYGIKKLMAELGIEGFYQMMNQKALYGTLMHLIIADYFRNGKQFDTDSLYSRVQDFVAENNIRFDTNRWVYELNKDLRALVQWAIDYEVSPIAIECVGYYDNGQHRFAGAIDLVCEMTIKEKGFYGEVYKTGANKDQPKETYETRRVLAIVDFKSNRNSFHDDHEIQLSMYRMMAEHSLGIHVEKVFNVSPKDWDKSPTYNCKDQTDTPERARIPYLLGSFFVEWEEPKDILVMSGKLNGGNMADCTRLVSAKEWVLNKLNLKLDFNHPAVKKTHPDTNEESKQLIAKIANLSTSK